MNSSPSANGLNSYELLLESKIDFNKTFSSILNSSNDSSTANLDVNVRFENNLCFITVLTIFNIILSFLCINNNSFIIWIVFRNARMQTVTNYFLSNLAVADIIIGVCVAPFQVYFNFLFLLHLYIYIKTYQILVSSCFVAKMDIS
jgi:hypothetical protein